jgi:TetR/AcrR family transcriptional regulator
MAGKTVPQEQKRIRARNRAAILAAAIALFVAKGFDGTTIAGIAARAGLPKANVYYYFRTKEAIYRTIIDQLLQGWDEAMEELRPEREPSEALAAYIRAKLGFARRHAALSKMFANEIVHGGRFLTRADRAHIRAMTVEKAKVFEAWADAGKMAPVDPIHLFILLWGATQYYADFEVLAGVALAKRRPSREDFETAARTITEIVLKGCKAIH